MYTQRLARNFRPVLREHGVVIHAKINYLDSISARHVHNIANGTSTPTLKKLEEIADEIGADMLEFFRE